MSDYYLDQYTLVVTPLLSNDIVIMASITEANKHFTIRESCKHKFIVCAKTKPVDKPFQELKWLEDDSQKDL